MSTEPLGFGCCCLFSMYFWLGRLRLSASVSSGFDRREFSEYGNAVNAYYGYPYVPVPWWLPYLYYCPSSFVQTNFFYGNILPRCLQNEGSVGYADEGSTLPECTSSYWLGSVWQIPTCELLTGTSPELCKISILPPICSAYAQNMHVVNPFYYYNNVYPCAWCLPQPIPSSFKLSSNVISNSLHRILLNNEAPISKQYLFQPISSFDETRTSWEMISHPETFQNLYAANLKMEYPSLPDARTEFLNSHAEEKNQPTIPEPPFLPINHLPSEELNRLNPQHLVSDLFVPPEEPAVQNPAHSVSPAWRKYFHQGLYPYSYNPGTSTRSVYDELTYSDLVDRFQPSNDELMQNVKFESAQQATETAIPNTLRTVPSDVLGMIRSPLYFPTNNVYSNYWRSEKSDAVGDDFYGSTRCWEDIKFGDSDLGSYLQNACLCYPCTSSNEVYWNGMLHWNGNNEQNSIFGHDKLARSSVTFSLSSATKIPNESSLATSELQSAYVPQENDAHEGKGSLMQRDRTSEEITKLSYFVDKGRLGAGITQKVGDKFITRDGIVKLDSINEKTSFLKATGSAAVTDIKTQYTTTKSSMFPNLDNANNDPYKSLGSYAPYRMFGLLGPGTLSTDSEFGPLSGTGAIHQETTPSPSSLSSASPNQTSHGLLGSHHGIIFDRNNTNLNDTLGSLKSVREKSSGAVDEFWQNIYGGRMNSEIQFEDASRSYDEFEHNSGFGGTDQGTSFSASYGNNKSAQNSDVGSIKNLTATLERLFRPYSAIEDSGSLEMFNKETSTSALHPSQSSTTKSPSTLSEPASLLGSKSYNIDEYSFLKILKQDMEIPNSEVRFRGDIYSKRPKSVSPLENSYKIDSNDVIEPITPKPNSSALDVLRNSTAGGQSNEGTASLPGSEEHSNKVDEKLNIFRFLKKEVDALPSDIAKQFWQNIFAEYGFLNTRMNDIELTNPAGHTSRSTVFSEFRANVDASPTNNVERKLDKTVDLNDTKLNVEHSDIFSERNGTETTLDSGVSSSLSEKPYLIPKTAYVTTSHQKISNSASGLDSSRIGATADGKYDVPRFLNNISFPLTTDLVRALQQKVSSANMSNLLENFQKLIMKASPDPKNLLIVNQLLTSMNGSHWQKSLLNASSIVWRIIQEKSSELQQLNCSTCEKEIEEEPCKKNFWK